MKLTFRIALTYMASVTGACLISYFLPEIFRTEIKRYAIVAVIVFGAMATYRLRRAQSIIPEVLNWGVISGMFVGFIYGAVIQISGGSILHYAQHLPQEPDAQVVVWAVLGGVTLIMYLVPMALGGAAGFLASSAALFAWRGFDRRTVLVCAIVIPAFMGCVLL
ncbi:hypothetical protein ACFELO_05820 [Oceanicaulis sp. LC35]|uniref:hypothetical protein n=1 Tax=Oceanicaulis sp. LC35 TaxID=3349635 RepID=UPI003F87E22A